MDLAWSRKYDQTEFMPPGRPKQWRNKCFEVLQTSIAARLVLMSFTSLMLKGLYIIWPLSIDT